MSVRQSADQPYNEKAALGSSTDPDTRARLLDDANVRGASDLLNWGKNNFGRFDITGDHRLNSGELWNAIRTTSNPDDQDKLHELLDNYDRLKKQNSDLFGHQDSISIDDLKKNLSVESDTRQAHEEKRAIRIKHENESTSAHTIAAQLLETTDANPNHSLLKVLDDVQGGRPTDEFGRRDCKRFLEEFDQRARHGDVGNGAWTADNRRLVQYLVDNWESADVKLLRGTFKANDPDWAIPGGKISLENLSRFSGVRAGEDPYEAFRLKPTQAAAPAEATVRVANDAPVVPPEAPSVPADARPVVASKDAPVVPPEAPSVPADAPPVASKDVPVVPPEAPSVPDAPPVVASKEAPVVAPEAPSVPTDAPPVVASKDAPVVPPEAPSVPDAPPVVASKDAPVVPPEAPSVPDAPPVVASKEAPVVAPEAPSVPTDAPPVVASKDAPVVPPEAPSVPDAPPVVASKEAPVVPPEAPSVPTDAPPAPAIKMQSQFPIGLDELIAKPQPSPATQEAPAITVPPESVAAPQVPAAPTTDASDTPVSQQPVLKPSIVEAPAVTEAPHVPQPIDLPAEPSPKLAPAPVQAAPATAFEPVQKRSPLQYDSDEARFADQLKDWGKNNFGKFDIDGDHRLNLAEIQLGLRTSNDPTDRVMLAELNSNYGRIKKENSDLFGHLDSISKDDLKKHADIKYDILQRHEQALKDQAAREQSEARSRQLASPLLETPNGRPQYSLFNTIDDMHWNGATGHIDRGDCEKYLKEFDLRARHGDIGSGQFSMDKRVYIQNLVDNWDQADVQALRGTYVGTAGKGQKRTYIHDNISIDSLRAATGTPGNSNVFDAFIAQH